MLVLFCSLQQVATDCFTTAGHSKAIFGAPSIVANSDWIRKVECNGEAKLALQRDETERFYTNELFTGSAAVYACLDSKAGLMPPPQAA